MRWSADYTLWRPYFAWQPYFTSDTKEWIWLEWIYRRSRTPAGHDPLWEYAAEPISQATADELSRAER